jgi:dienelactone hydrolase
VVERPSATPAPAPVERAPEAPPTVSPRIDEPSKAPLVLAADDPALIRDALQRYRRAYNALDARLAHAVYPGVDEAALTHAFEGLRSQSLEFEACTVDALAESARAVCRGSARYVPKIGSSQPRAETRVWTFRLRKNSGDWTIESAWTDR